MLRKGEAHFANQGNNLNSSLLNIPRFQEEQEWRKGETGRADELKH